VDHPRQGEVLGVRVSDERDVIGSAEKVLECWTRVAIGATDESATLFKR
jgi:hypothetical protein